MTYRVSITTPCWHLNGVNTVSASLLRGLTSLGVPGEILLTDTTPRGLEVFPPPEDIPFRRLPAHRRIRAHLKALARDLASNTPTVYLPGYDYRHSGVSPILPDSVVIVGVVHGDDPLHFDHVARLGRYWNAVVCVSRLIERRIHERFPELAERTLTIHNGVDLPSSAPAPRQRDDATLRIAWAGRVVREGKRAMDIPRLLDCLEKLGTPVCLTVAGDGDCLPDIRLEAARHIAAGRLRLLGAVSNASVHALFEQSDLFLLTSDRNEGLPISMLEAMARGCVPIVTDIESGVPEVVRHENNGLILPAGDMPRFAKEIAALAAAPQRLADLSAEAIRTVHHGAFNTRAMARAYKDLFDRLVAEAARGAFHRPAGSMQLPWRPTLRDRLSLLYRRFVPRPQKPA
ncbi:MAG: glycosyltransferase [Verrucomicrobia bacterium]|nr:MAG: glycosyltransferase [Verrucomicrobiota bacterium]